MKFYRTRFHINTVLSDMNQDDLLSTEFPAVSAKDGLATFRTERWSRIIPVSELIYVHITPSNLETDE